MANTRGKFKVIIPTSKNRKTPGVTSSFGASNDASPPCLQFSQGPKRTYINILDSDHWDYDDSSRMEKVLRSLDFSCGIEVGSPRSKGGLTLCWKEAYKICSCSNSSSHIDVLVEEDSEGNQWWFIGFYGSLVWRLRDERLMDDFRSMLENVELFVLRKFRAPKVDVFKKMVLANMHINLEIDKAERYWEQRARATWLRHGDRSTVFFHRFATQHR
ncbi:hypothetical protein GOBAR_AA00023 [Gossypium barbadense]|uniref:DUF4283 domain-containing protein n=1 Tax=Gossypium barbadense TaxID=3634 RepID=A0A2P5YY90_GOSBA|nr:hypothetical protein GOBAR_AA00023 [Gossypium barbadense]